MSASAGWATGFSPYAYKSWNIDYGIKIVQIEEQTPNIKDEIAQKG